MATDRRRIGAEVATVALVAACLVATLNLVISVHRRALQAPKVAQVAPPPAPEPEPEPAPAPPVEPPAIVEVPQPVPEPEPVAEDPTPAVLASLAEKAAKEREEAGRLDREAAKMETARKAAEAGAESWRRREMLVRQQLAAMDEKARKTARDADAYAAQRDVLARERDALKAAIATAPGEGSYAVLPYQGENGTWRRPIVIECTGGQVSILPNGPSFSVMDLSGLATPRSSPVVVAIARELLKVQNSATPDGSAAVPYFVFLVRPDGVRSYYEVRSRLEPLGIAFGYELVDADMKIHVPDYDNLAAWDGTPSVNVPASGLAGNGTGNGNGPSGGGEVGDKPGGTSASGAWPTGGGGGDKPASGALAGGGLSWPGGGGDKPGDDAKALAGAFDLGRGRGRGTGTGDGGAGDGPESFVWPSQGPGGAAEGSTGGEGESKDGADAGGPGPLGLGGATRGDSPLAHDVGRGGLLGAGIKPATRDIGRPADARRGAATGYDRPGAGPNASGVRGGPAPGGAGMGAGGLEPAPAAAAEPATPEQGGGLMWGGSAPVGVTPSVADGYRGGRLAGAPAGANLPGDDGTGPTDGKPAAGPSGNRPGNGSRGSKPGAGSTTGSATGAGSAPGSSGGSPGSASKPPPISLGTGGGGVRIPLGMSSSGGAAPPGLMLGADSEPTGGASAGAAGASGGGSGGADSGDPDMQPLIQDPEKKRPPAIDVPFEIVVACNRDGVTIQPGNRRITSQALKNRRSEELLVRNLEAEARRRADVDPAIRPRPRVRFLVQEDGASNFWEARRQLLFAGLDWPMTLQVAGAQNPKLLDDKGIW